MEVLSYVIVFLFPNTQVTLSPRHLHALLHLKTQWSSTSRCVTQLRSQLQPKEVNLKGLAALTMKQKLWVVCVWGVWFTCLIWGASYLFHNFQVFFKIQYCTFYFLADWKNLDDKAWRWPCHGGVCENEIIYRFNQKTAHQHTYCRDDGNTWVSMDQICYHETLFKHSNYCLDHVVQCYLWMLIIEYTRTSPPRSVKVMYAQGIVALFPYLEDPYSQNGYVSKGFKIYLPFELLRFTFTFMHLADAFIQSSEIIWMYISHCAYIIHRNITTILKVVQATLHGGWRQFNEKLLRKEVLQLVHLLKVIFIMRWNYQPVKCV